MTLLMKTKPDSQTHINTMDNVLSEIDEKGKRFSQKE